MMEEKISVRIDKDLEDLIPGYLENRRKDIAAIAEALSGGDYEKIRVIGHGMKGSGGGYGFDGITAIGWGIEEAAKAHDGEKIRGGAAELDTYLKSVDITYA